MANFARQAHQWLECGYTPLPIRPDGTKAPAVPWARYQTTPPTPDDLDRIFALDHDGLGLLCGATSRNLEMLEFEGRAVNQGLPAQLAQTMADHGASDLWDTITTGYVEVTPSGGLHYLYRVDGPAARNTKLARRPATPDELAKHPGNRVQVLIETRGEGGFTVIAPSAGRTHPSGKPWTLIRGGRDTIPTISVDQRDLLYVAATLLDALPTPQLLRDETQREGSPNATSGARPGDDYNMRASWDDLLVPRGWRKVRQFGGNRLGWVRPGKSPHNGISATTGGAVDGIDRLYVFSTSTEFESEQPYTKFGAYALLEHGGDYAAAAKQLAAEGWGSTPEAANPGPALTLLRNTPNDLTTPPVLRILPSPAAGRPATDGSNALAIAPIDITLATYGPTEDGLARALIDHHGHQLRYCPQRSSWLAWDGTRWRWDDAGSCRELIKELARQLPENDTWKTHRKRTLSAHGISGVAAMAATITSAVVDLENLDADPWILNTPNGIIDLRNGTLRPPSPDDLCTRTTGVTYDPHATAPRWQQFLTETFSGDVAMIAYVQRLLGYSACGAVSHHVMPFAFGGGQNGKSVFLDVAMGVLGEYASSTPNRFLMAGRDDESAIARLAGLRLVVASEVNERDRFDEAKVKLLTGGDRLTARFLYGNYFTFVPTHHLWLMGNHQPRVEAGGDSFWRRLRLLPFTNRVPDDKTIPDLDRLLLEEEAPGILAWIIQGAIDALGNDSLRDPDSVRSATATYAEEEDALARFVNERIMLTSQGREPTAEVRAAYVAWCKSEGEQEMSPQTFGRDLRSRWGITVTKSNGRKHYEGMTLLRDTDEEEDTWTSLRWDQR